MSRRREVPAGVSPDFGAVAASAELGQIVGALMTIVLILAVLMFIVSAVAWGLSNSTGSYHGATRARTGVLVAALTAAAAGAGIAWANFLIATGEGL